MPEPKRIQRKRTRGWRMPEGAVFVGRPSKWGNPYTLPDVRAMYPEYRGAEIRLQALRCYRAYGEHWALVAEWSDFRNDRTVSALWSRIETTGAKNMREYAPFELRGKDLACWCALDQPCHADVLLEWANAGDGR